jgi:hypothetical protein
MDTIRIILIAICVSIVFMVELAFVCVIAVMMGSWLVLILGAIGVSYAHNKLLNSFSFGGYTPRVDNRTTK